jgi:hypothetical protein
MTHKTALGLLSIGIGAAAYTVYIGQTAKKKGVQPHPLSWILWGLVTGVAYLVQRERGGAAGSWVTGFTSCVCFLIGGLSLAKRTWRFSRFDKVSIWFGLGVLLFYVLSRNPTHSAILATIVDVVGYLPTVKKAWIEPYKDSATSFSLNSVKFVPALLALQSYSVATWLYPVTLVVVNGGVATLLLVRRRTVSNDTISLD